VRRDEVVVLMGMIRTAYPRFYSNMTKDEARQAIDLWSTMFADDDAKIVTEAVKAMITTLKFPPTIADVKEKIRLITIPERMTEMEAWNLVYDAICSANYSAQANFDRLPPTIQRIVGSPNSLKEWAMMEADIVKSVIQSNFMRSYRMIMENEKQLEMLPQSTKLFMLGLNESFKMLEG